MARQGQCPCGPRQTEPALKAEAFPIRSGAGEQARGGHGRFSKEGTAWPRRRPIQTSSRCVLANSLHLGQPFVPIEKLKSKYIGSISLSIFFLFHSVSDIAWSLRALCRVLFHMLVISAKHDTATSGSC